MSQPRPGGSVVSMSDSWLGGCEFDPRLRQLFIPAYFRLSPLRKHVRKVVSGFGKRSCVSTGVRRPGNSTRLRPPWYDLSCRSGVKPQYNQPTNLSWVLESKTPWLVSVSDSSVQATFLSGAFSAPTSAEACEKSSRWLWKEKLC